MIDDATIDKLALNCGIRYRSTPKGTKEMFCYFDNISAFAKACYAAGQDAQRESDAVIAENKQSYGTANDIRLNKEP